MEQPKQLTCVAVSEGEKCLQIQLSPQTLFRLEVGLWVLSSRLLFLWTDP